MTNRRYDERKTLSTISTYKYKDEAPSNYKVIMSTVLRRNRKGSDRDITRLNSLGFSLSKIGERLSCHPTSITLRLKSLKISPADTRRAFMEDIWNDLPLDFQEEVADLIENGNIGSIKGYIRNLIHADIMAKRPAPKLELVSNE